MGHCILNPIKIVGLKWAQNIIKFMLESKNSILVSVYFTSMVDIR